jgi:HK97 gp10 family phage protein
MNVKLSLTGHIQIDQVLRALPLELSHTVLSAAHMDAAKPLIQKEKLLAPEGPTGNLIDSIGAVKTPFKKANVVGEVTVGPRRTRKLRGQHGHLVEFGTVSRENKKGANRGVMPAEPFAEPAFEQTKEQVINRISVSVGRKLNNTMRRYIK